MVDINKKLGVTELVLRDGHQSLFATRMRIDDMLPIAAKLDQVGYWSLETWGGATFDACIRYLGEDPWDRIRELKAAMPKTPQQMLLRGQNLLGYRHYADDVVNKFVERCAINGVDVFRIFDAMNDSRNLETAIQAVKRCGKHAQGTISYTTSPVHTLSMWIDFAKKLEDMQVDSIAIKDMSGILRPYEAYELVKALKAQTNLEVQLHAHATSGIADMTLLKAIEAGVDRVDTSISSMSMTYGHTATETVVASLQGQPRDTGLDITLLEDIAAYFREVRKKYAKFEGSLRGTDSRILIAQVPGGMLTNMESQLKEQGAADRFDEVLAEIPKVRKDLGFIPLVTPTSQIVGTQAVINTLMGERYKSISKEVQSILKGEYGRAPAEFDADLQQKVLNGEKAITCRPADLLSAEFEQLQLELKKLAEEKNITLAKGECEVDDVLSYALFPQVGLKFLENRGNANAFEAVPTAADSKDLNTSEQASKIVAKEANQVYTVKVNGQNYVVEVSEGGDVTSFSEQADRAKDAGVSQPSSGVASNQSQGESIAAPLAGNIWKVMVTTGQQIKAGDVLVILEAMKMETEVRAYKDGCILTVDVKEGDTVQVGDSLVTLA